MSTIKISSKRSQKSQILKNNEKILFLSLDKIKIPLIFGISPKYFHSFLLSIEIAYTNKM